MFERLAGCRKTVAFFPLTCEKMLKNVELFALISNKEYSMTQTLLGRMIKIFFSFS